MSIWGQYDIRNTVRYKDVMMEYGLGPNVEILTFELGEDATIRTKAVLLHHVLVPRHVTDINVGPEWQCHHRRVKVNDIHVPKQRFIFFSMVFAYRA
jgi:hypothetical protein